MQVSVAHAGPSRPTNLQYCLLIIKLNISTLDQHNLETENGKKQFKIKEKPKLRPLGSELFVASMDPFR